MEFFKIVDVKTSEAGIQEKINLDSINEFVESIFVLEKQSDYSAQIGGIWGEFTLKYDKINGGVRFYLVECPNAFTWTITTGFPPEREKIVIHLTINRTRKQQEFIEEIEMFLNEWEKGLLSKF